MIRDLPASLTSPEPTQSKTPLPGWRAIVVRDWMLVRLQCIQASTIDPHLDLRDLDDASVPLTLDEALPASIVERAVEERRRRFYSVQTS